MRARFSTVGIVAFAAVVLAGSCSGGSVEIHNESSSTVVIMEIDAEGESPYGEIDAGGGMVVHTRCIDDDLEARLEDGTVISARQGPFCEDDPAWVITQQDVK